MGSDVLVRTPPGTAPFAEDEWLGRTATVGDGVRVEFVASSERCVMVNEAQADLPAAADVLRAVADAHDTRLDALARVLTPGHVAVGDRLVLD